MTIGTRDWMLKEGKAGDADRAVHGRTSRRRGPDRAHRECSREGLRRRQDDRRLFPVSPESRGLDSGPSPRDQQGEGREFPSGPDAPCIRAPALLVCLIQQERNIHCAANIANGHAKVSSRCSASSHEPSERQPVIRLPRPIGDESACRSTIRLTREATTCQVSALPTDSRRCSR